MSDDDPNADLYASEEESLEDILEYARARFAHADATIEARDVDDVITELFGVGGRAWCTSFPVV